MLLQDHQVIIQYFQQSHQQVVEVEDNLLEQDRDVQVDQEEVGLQDLGDQQVQVEQEIHLQ